MYVKLIESHPEVFISQLPPLTGHYMVINPNTLAMELMRIMVKKMGQT